MRIVLNDKEWYYGRFIVIGGIVFFSLCAGAFIFLDETKKDEKNNEIPINQQDIEISPATSMPLSTPSMNSNEKGINIKQEQETPNISQHQESLIAVAIQGAVQKPGLYWIEANSRLQTLIDMAGGTSPNAETRYLNLAAPLIDGTTVVIPEKQKIEFDGRSLKARGHSNPTAYTVPPIVYHSTVIDKGYEKQEQSKIPNKVGNTNPVSENSTATLIDINHATQQELETLPGIGPALAKAIISYREAKPFESIDELTSVSGIGPKRFEKIRPFVTVTPP